MIMCKDSLRCGKAREWASRVSVVRVIRARWAVSLAVQASRHVGHMLGLLNLSWRDKKENASRMGQPTVTSAGDTPQSGSGVLRSRSRARNSPSLSREPDVPHEGVLCLFDGNHHTAVRLREVS